MLAALRNHFPNIKDVNIEMFGATPLLFAEIEGHKKKLPLNYLSGGLTKLAAMLAAIPNLQGGIVLIDEIENGFHFRKLPRLWDTLLHMCEAYDVQLFASTHSYECLKAAAISASKTPDKFSLIQAVRTEDGCDLKQFNGSQFNSAIDADVEIR